MPWGTPQVLAPSAQYAFDPQLAVGEDGQTLAAWFGGARPPPVRSKGTLVAPETVWSGSDVVVDTGTVAAGFGPQVVLSTHGSDKPEGLQVALSGSGVAYAAWEQYRGTWMISSARDREAFSAPRPLLPRGDSQMVALVRSAAGPVAAVWLSYASMSSSTAMLHYSLLRADGGLGRAVTVGSWNGGTEGTPFALNDRGAFAAVDIAGQNGEGTRAPYPVVHVCDAAGRCLRRHKLTFGHMPAGAYENNAIAFSDDGTVTVLAGYFKTPKNPGPSKPLGLWDTLRRPRGRWSSPQELSTAGERPLAVADGRHSVITVFQHFWEPDMHFNGNRLDISTLPAAAARFTNPAILVGHEAPEPPALAASLTGDFLVAWNRYHPEGEGKESGIVAVTGSAGHRGSPQLVVSSETASQTPQAGLDRAGEAVVLWNGSAGSQGGGQGVFASVHRGR
jgi:hypothetical protein